MVGIGNVGVSEKDVVFIQWSRDVNIIPNRHSSMKILLCFQSIFYFDPPCLHKKVNTIDEMLFFKRAIIFSFQMAEEVIFNVGECWTFNLGLELTWPVEDGILFVSLQKLSNKAFFSKVVW